MKSMYRDYFLHESKELKKAGFRVFVSKDDGYTYGYAVTANEELAYFQYDGFDGWAVSTVHLPNKVSGTGYRIDYDPQKSLADNIMIAAKTFVPVWARRDRGTVKKFAGLEAFMNYHSGWRCEHLVELEEDKKVNN